MPPHPEQFWFLWRQAHGNVRTSRSRDQSKDFTNPLFPVHCKSKQRPHVPSLQPVLGLHVAFFFHSSDPEPRPEVGTGMDTESAPPPKAYSQAAAGRIGTPCPKRVNAPVPFSPQDHPLGLLSPYSAQWSRSFSVLFCGNRKSKQAYLLKQRGIFTADMHLLPHR